MRTVIAVMTLALTAALPACGGNTIAAGSAPKDDATEVAFTPQPVPSLELNPAETYIDVTGKGAIVQDLRLNDGTYGQRGEPVPGVLLSQHQPDGSPQSCTLGPAVYALDDGSQGWLTAGHCDPSPGESSGVWLDALGKEKLTLGVISDSLTALDYGLDYAVLWSSTGRVPAASTALANTWPIAGMMSTEDVQGLPAGTPICIDGAKAGVKCTPLLDATETWIEYEDVAGKGDSGAPVFVVTRDGDAQLIGLLRGFDTARPGVGLASYLTPALERTGARLMTAAG